MTIQPQRKLPDESISPASARDIVKTVIGSIIMVFAVNIIALFVLHHYTTNVGYSRIRQKWRMLCELYQPVDWLVLGDSSGNQGVVPDIISEKLGGTAINLCTTGRLLAVNDAWMIEEYIERYGRPKNVIIIHVYDIWSREINQTLLTQIPLRFGFWNRYTPQITLRPDKLIRFIRTRYFPLYSENISLSHLLLPFGSTNNSGIHFSDNGFMFMSTPDPRNAMRDVAQHIESVIGRSFRISPLNEEALSQIALLAKQYNFPVYIVNSPLAADLYENPAFQEYFKQVKEYLVQYARKSDNIFYLLQSPELFPREYLQTADHLANRGAVSRYTKRICSEIESVQHHF